MTMQRVRGLLALLGLTVLLVGMPILLILANPLGLPHVTWTWDGLRRALLTPDDGTLALTVFKAAGWVTWAVLAFAVLIEITARIRRLPVPQLRGLWFPQALAHQLVAASLAVFTVAGPMLGTAVPAIATPDQPAPTRTIGDLPMYKQPGHRIVTVERGDTLSAIALETTGKAANYPKLFKASTATRQPGGRHLTDPDLILPGWRITIPTAGKPDHKPNAGKPDTEPGRPSLPNRPPTPTAPTATATAPAPTVAPNLPDAESADAAHAGVVRPSWLLTGLAGAGALLAGGLWLVLSRRRQLQHWTRRPGRSLRFPAPHLARVEKTIQYEGAPTGDIVRWVDETLHRLASSLLAADRALPSLVGVDVTHDNLTVRLSQPCALPEPWRAVDDEQLAWRLPADCDADEVGELVEDSPSPWPQLACPGADASGWRLVNLEALGVLTLTGDPAYVADLTRYLAAELAVAPWARDVIIDCLGCCYEIRNLSPERVRHHTTPDLAPERVAAAVQTADRLEAAGKPNLETARVTFAGDELWASRLLITTRDLEHLGTLTDLIDQQRGRTGTTVLIATPNAEPVGIEVQLTSTGRVWIPKLGLDLIANGLTEAEASGCATILATATSETDLDDAEAAPDEPMLPLDEPALGEWTTWSDQAGALRPEHTVPRDPDHIDERSLLSAPDQRYTEASATTTEDLAVLAPAVPAAVREQVEAADPTLDADLAGWWADSCDRPRLAVLGPVKVRLGRHGVPTEATSRVPFCSEIVAFLSTRPRGVTKEEFAAAFNISPNRVRKDASMVRSWLGTNPATGEPWLPNADKNHEAVEQGRPLYFIHGLLSDADLFRRLRVRGEARGADGIYDLFLALKLVTGRPFDHLRKFGGIWLADTRIDQHLLCGIVDVAHIVTVRSLEADNIKQAQAATEIALLAAPYESVPQLDLAAIVAHEGDPEKAAAITRALVGQCDSDGYPVDTPDRTDRIVGTHGWLQPTRRAS